MPNEYDDLREMVMFLDRRIVVPDQKIGDLDEWAAGRGFPELARLLGDAKQQVALATSGMNVDTEVSAGPDADMADAGDEADQYPLTLVPGPPTPAAQLLPGSPSEATPPSDQSPPAQPPLEERTNVGTEGSAGSDTDMADVDAAYTDPAPGAADHGGGQNDDSKFVPEIGKLFVWKDWIGEVVGDVKCLPEPNRALRNVQWYREDSDGVTIEPKPKNQAFKGGGDAVRGWEYIVDEEAQDLRNQIDAARAAQARPPRSTALHTPPVSPVPPRPLFFCPPTLPLLSVSCPPSTSTLTSPASHVPGRWGAGR